jgi:RNA polymerase sigma factor (sigma-70 family)
MNEDPPDDEPENDEPSLLSDKPTMELILRAKAGDDAALEAVVQRCLPPLRQWARGRLPSYARGEVDTEDLVQQAVTNVLVRLDRFQPTHVGAMQAYLRQSVINDIRSRIRVVTRRTLVELPDDLGSGEASPEERAISADSYDRYRHALATLRVRDRELIIARVESQWTIGEAAERFGYKSENSARMAVTRAIRRLRAAMATQT